MNRYAILLIALAVIFIACGWGKTPVEPDTSILKGTWIGISHYTGPGPADEPIEYTDSIQFSFFDSTFLYSRFGTGTPEDQLDWFGTGRFILTRDSISLVEVKSPPYFPPSLSLEGTFHFQYDDNKIAMRQVLHPGIWPETRILTLDKYGRHNRW